MTYVCVCFLKVEISIIYKNVTGGVVQFGLPERRVSETMQVKRKKIDDTIDILMATALRRLENAEVSGSVWTFHSFVSVTMRVSTNVAMNSNLVNEQIGGNGDGGGQQYILSEADEDGGATADDEEEVTDDEVAAAAFIDDREVEDDDVTMYREVDDDEVVDRNRVIVTDKEEELNLDDYKIPEDETIDLLSGEDSDQDDRESRGESTLKEACDILGVTLAPDTAAVMNAAIDKVTIVTRGEEGSCTYRSILNGIFAKKFDINKEVTEERFATCLPKIYQVVSAYKEELQYVTVGDIADVLEPLNDQLVKLGYVINVYERKPKTFLIDVITNRRQNNSFMISVVQAHDLYDDTEDLCPDQIHLMFKRVEGMKILDMGVCTDISVIIKALRHEKCKMGFKLKKLHICERCRVCFIKKTVYIEHVRWCKGKNTQHFVFEKRQDFETYEEFVRCRDTPLVTAYYDFETETSHEEFKVISFSYVVAFRQDLCMQNIIVFRSAIMDVEALTTIPMGSHLRSCLDDEDMKNITMCAHDVISQRPHAMAQLLVMELTTIERTFGRTMEFDGGLYGILPQPKIDEAMVDYSEKKCYLCGFGLNNIEPVPYRECVVFFLRKLYLEEYCQTIVEKPDHTPDEWTEDKLVSVWLEAMETIHRGESTISDEEIAHEKLSRGMESFHVPHCSLVMRARYPNHRVYMTGALEQELLNILNDEVVVHHCHFTGTVYGPVHKRCNSKARIDPFRMKMHIYAHNATFFDNAFILKGINLSLLAQKGRPFPYLHLMGENPSSVKTIQLDNCVFKDSLKLFESSLDDLCKLKSTMEKIRTDEMIHIFLAGHEHFAKIYKAMTNDESRRLMALLNGKGYFCYDYITSRDVLKETSLPPVEMFKNQLDQKIPDAARYKEAEEIWKLLQCRNIDDYNCIYNVMDTINLAVIMEERMATLKDYLKFDPPALYVDERIWSRLRQVQDAVHRPVYAQRAHYGGGRRWNPWRFCQR